MNPFLTSELITLHHQDLLRERQQRRQQPGRGSTLRRNPPEPPNSL